MSKPGDLDLNRSGDLRKPRTRKQAKTCAECGVRFNTRSRYARHELAHRAAEETGYTVAECEDSLRELEQAGLLHRTCEGFIIEDEDSDA